MKYLFVFLIYSVYTLKNTKRIGDNNKVIITNNCIIQNCQKNICGQNCTPDKDEKACELNKETTSFYYHFHALIEEPNKVLIKKYRDQNKEYIKCEIEKKDGQNSIKRCENTTRHKKYTLSNKLIIKINKIIEDC